MRASGPRRTNVPAIPEIARSETAIDSALKALKEATEVGYGRRGDPLDRFVTMRDLKGAGLGTVVVGPGGAALAPPSGGSGAPLVPYVPPDYGDTDYTVPPAPTGVTGRGVPPDSIMVTWDPPNYGNHAYAEVYALLENPDGSPRTLGELQADLPAGYAGRADGTIFMHRNLVNVPRTTDTTLDAALYPSVRYYWVRFVSTAGVKGPFAPLRGAAVPMSIDPVLVLDAMIANVTATPIYGNLRSFIGVIPNDPIIQAGGVLGYITATASSIDGRLQSLWSVNMRHNTSTGLVYSTGFGLGIETDETTGRSLSTFLINANQFAIMGATGGMPGAAITGITGFSVGTDAIVRAYVFTASHGFNLTDRKKVTISGATGAARINATTTIPSPFERISGVDGFVVGTGVDGLLRNYLDILLPGLGIGFPTLPTWADPQHPSYNATWVERFSPAAMPPTSIPFVVDTTRNVVGIRGDLIVDGLVRAQSGVFGELTATNAFVDHMRSNIIDANVIVGQRIIAGAPGIGAISTGAYQAISNYVIELNNPVANNFALRFWKPQTNDVRFSLDRAGNMVVGGHMSVAGNGVIGTTGTNLASFGGAGADGDYAMWIGPQSGYGTNGAGRTEATGAFWVKDNGRAGFNLDLFLGENALALPILTANNQAGAAVIAGTGGPRAGSSVVSAVSSTPIAIKALRNGGMPVVWVQASGYLMSQNTSGDGDNKRFTFRVQLVGSPGATTGIVVQTIQMDDYFPEAWTFSLSGAVQAPAGNYWVRLDILPPIENRPMSIMTGWNAIAMQVTANGGLAA